MEVQKSVVAVAKVDESVVRCKRLAVERGGYEKTIVAYKRTGYFVITADAITAIAISTVRYTECTNHTMNHVHLSDTGHRQRRQTAATASAGR